MKLGLETLPFTRAFASDSRRPEHGIVCKVHSAVEKLCLLYAELLTVANDVDLEPRLCKECGAHAQDQ